MLKQYLEIGQIVTTHGVMGEVKIYPWCDSPEVLCALPRLYLSEGGRAVRVESARVHKNMCLVQLEGVQGMDAGRALVGKTVWAARADLNLEPGRWFVQDILGCTVQDADTGEVYGRGTHVSHPGANDVYTVKNDAGEEFLFPAVPAFLHKLDPEAGLVLVRPIPGIFTPQRNGDE